MKPEKVFRIGSYVALGDEELAERHRELAGGDEDVETATDNDLGHLELGDER